MALENFTYRTNESSELPEFKWASAILNMSCIFQIDKLTINDQKELGISYNLLAHTNNFDEQVFEPQLQELVIALYSEDALGDSDE